MLSTILKAVASRIWLYLSVAGLLAVAALYAFARQQGRSAAAREALEKRIASIQRKKVRDDEIQSLDPAERDKRFNKWLRD